MSDQSRAIDSAAYQEGLAARLDRKFSAALREKRVVGAVAIVAKDGEVVYRKAHGLADREAQRSMIAETQFRLASITKPIVTLAALQLVARGDLRLEDPVTRWLPEFRPKLSDGRVPTVTIHQLLTHTAGLSYALWQEPGSIYHRLGISDGLDLTDIDLAENLRRLASAPLFYAPGTSWGYSLGLDVVGAVLEEVVGRPLPAVVDELVAQPLGLRNTGFVAADAASFATPYANAQPEPVRMVDNMVVPFPEGMVGAVRFAPSRVAKANAFPSGGAGMYGDADDVVKVLEAIRQADKVLPRALADAMRTNHAGSNAATRGPGWGFGYGGAILVDPALANSPQSKGTMTWGGVYGHSWFVDSACGLSAVLLTNTAYEGMAGKLTVDVRDAIYER